MPKFANHEVLSFVQRIERLAEEKKSLADDMKEVYSEAKGSGLDTKILRKVVALRKMDPADRQEMEHLLALYMSAIQTEQASQPES
jgi:uncharacterized protein (UPF0335 family)